MLEVVHITFEKLTGLSGTIEGQFSGDIALIDQRLPMIFEATLISHNTFVFRQGEQYIYLKPVDFMFTANYWEHFKHGINFLVKVDNGRGVGTDISKNVN